jgi:HB1, ASXL, restriction endonuclease HTH domain
MLLPLMTGLATVPSYPMKEATMATTTQKVTTKSAIAKVMTGKRKPMTVAEIADAAIPLTDLAGNTPKQTFYSVLYSESKRADGVVVQKGRGQFALNPKRKKAA